MKTIRFTVVAVLLAVMTGCATDGYNNTVTNTVAGGLIGGAVHGNKGAVIGGLLGAGIGVLSDSQNRKDAKEIEMVEKRGGNKSTTALRGQANSKEAVELYNTCQELRASTSSTYAKREIPDCSYIFHQASVNGARVETEKLMVKVDGVGGDDYGGSYHGRRNGNYDAWWDNFRRENDRKSRTYYRYRHR
ncbi:MAG: hypothetical protein Q7S11_03360 [bacterium]|nr:hypothetical protein [bacterium]